MAVLLVALLGPACAETRDPPRAVRPALPPGTFPELAEIFQPQVTPLGVRLTRAALVDVETRAPAPDGRHLALYVEPTEPWSEARYVETIVPLTRVFAPSVFRRWPELVSFDVCQEPPPGVDDRPEPPAVTTVDLRREVSQQIDWGTADLAALLRASARDPVGLRVNVAEPLQADPAYQEARARAEGRASP